MTEKKSGNVRGIRSDIKIEVEEPEPHPEVIQILEGLLELANKGEIQSLVCVAGFDDPDKYSHNTVGLIRNQYLMYSVLSSVTSMFKEQYIHPYVYPELMDWEE